MQELAKTIEDVASKESDYSCEADYSVLDTAARKWAEFALETFVGENLRTALDISRALVEFTNTVKSEE